MVAINKILLPECTGEGCGGKAGICTDSRVHRRNAENRVPATRNRCRTQPLVNNLYQGMTLDAMTGLYYERNRDYSPSLGRWMEQDPAQFINGANMYQFVNSSPEGNVDAWGTRLTGNAAQALLPAGYQVTDTPNLVSRTAVVDGQAHTTESGLIFRTYTTDVPERRTSVYRVRAIYAVPGACPEVRVFTITRVRQVTEVATSNNAGTINDIVNATEIAGTVTTFVGLFLPPPADLIVGASGIGVGLAGLVLSTAASHEEAAPVPPHAVLGRVLGVSIGGEP